MKIKLFTLLIIMSISIIGCPVIDVDENSQPIATPPIKIALRIAADQINQCSQFDFGSASGGNHFLFVNSSPGTSPQTNLTKHHGDIPSKGTSNER